VPGLADELAAEAATATAAAFDVSESEDSDEWPAQESDGESWSESPDDNGEPETGEESEGGDDDDESDESDKYDDEDPGASGTGDVSGGEPAASTSGGGASGDQDGRSQNEWAPGADDFTRHGASGKGRNGRRSRLRSYVAPRGGARQGQTAEDPSLQAHRDEVDLAGVAAAEEYERAAGRNPEVMDHGHEGYDIESEYADGEVARYIEVKSTAGAWDSLGVGVSDAQFSVALKTGEEYWLYVVEHALDPDQTRVYAICDPANAVGQFMFDDGWKGLAEAQQE
jgi:hypothetical protein